MTVSSKINQCDEVIQGLALHSPIFEPGVILRLAFSTEKHLQVEFWLLGLVVIGQARMPGTSAWSRYPEFFDGRCHVTIIASKQ
ncbi:MAG TPA: hypothetical protein VFE98_02930 [Candidatus Bathyarchaeia archaeon]|nr:hypothetical protein [Candidatus Bathyarchaeia archaeon]